MKIKSFFFNLKKKSKFENCAEKKRFVVDEKNCVDFKKRFLNVELFKKLKNKVKNEQNWERNSLFTNYNNKNNN
jgi:hypothetical protein